MKYEWKGLVGEETVVLPRRSENKNLGAQQGRKKGHK